MIKLLLFLLVFVALWSCSEQIINNDNGISDQYYAKTEHSIDLIIEEHDFHMDFVRASNTSLGYNWGFAHVLTDQSTINVLARLLKLEIETSKIFSLYVISGKDNDLSKNIIDIGNSYSVILNYTNSENVVCSKPINEDFLLEKRPLIYNDRLKGFEEQAVLQKERLINTIGDLRAPGCLELLTPARTRGCNE